MHTALVGHARNVEAPTVIADTQIGTVCLPHELQPNPCSTGMLHNIVHRLLDDPEDGQFIPFRDPGFVYSDAFLDGDTLPMVAVASCAAGSFAFILACLAVWIRRKVE